MRLGVIGGTFDPIHFGHLRAAETAREALGLDRMLFVTAHVPPHRRAESSALDRFAMTCLATANHPAFVASDLELQRPGPSYTVETLRALRALEPAARLVLVVGSDTLPEMATWHEAGALRELAEIAVVARPGEAPSALPAGVHRVAGPALAVAATEIRTLAAAGASLRYLVPDPVADYIVKRGLYR